MGDAIVDDAKRLLSRVDIAVGCPNCGSRKMLVSYARDFVVDLDKETSYETSSCELNPYCITCFKCLEVIYEE